VIQEKTEESVINVNKINKFLKKLKIETNFLDDKNIFITTVSIKNSLSRELGQVLYSKLFSNKEDDDNNLVISKESLHLFLALNKTKNIKLINSLIDSVSRNEELEIAIFVYHTNRYRKFLLTYNIYNDINKPKEVDNKEIINTDIAVSTDNSNLDKP